MNKAIVFMSKFAIVITLAVLCSAERLTGANASEGSTAGIKGDFCGSRVARDFLRPLAKMAPIHHLPASGKLPFGPKGLTLEARGGRLAVDGGWIGFGFSDEAVGQVRHLNWDVSVQLFEVNSKGAVIADAGFKRRHMGTIRGNNIKDFLLRVSGRAAFYRVDISFRHSSNNRVLGEFSNYVRAVRPSFDARLLMLGSVARQGELLPLRLANFGTETLSSLSYDWRFSVQYFNGQEWVSAPSNPLPKKHKPIIQKLPAGHMEECTHFRVPDNEKPGLYRFSMIVERTLLKTDERTVQVTAEFEVSGRSLK